MADYDIQMRKKTSDIWEKLFPFTRSKNVIHENGKNSEEVSTLIKSDINGLEKKVNTHLNDMTIIAKHKNILPNTDITIGLQNLVNEIETGTTLVFEPNATYQISNEILFTKDITLDFQNATLEVNTPQGVQNIFKFLGEEVTKKNITAKYNKGALSLSLSDTLQVKRGQTVLISSPQLYNTSRLNYRMGGYFIIENVTSNQIRLNQSMPFSFGEAGATATIFNPIVPVIKNVSIKSMKPTVIDGTMGIRVENSKNLHFYNVYVDGYDHNVLLRNHINSVIEKYSTGRSLYEGATQSYGLTSYTGTGFILRQSNLRSGRHALSLTGFEPSFNTLIENCSFDNEKSDDPHAFDCHDANHSLVMINSHCNGALFAGRCDVKNTTFTSSINKKVTLAKTNHFNYGHYTFENCDFTGIDIENGTYKQVKEDTDAEYIGLISIVSSNMKGSTLKIQDSIRIKRISIDKTEGFKILVNGEKCVIDDLTVSGMRSLDDTNIIASNDGKISNVSLRDCYFPSRYRAIYLPVNDNLFLDNVRFTTLTGKEPSSSTVETGSLFAMYSHVFMPSGGRSKITGKTILIGDESGGVTGGTLKTVTLT